MGTQTSERRTSPPYLPFKTFMNFIELLRATAVPQRIDSSVMSKYPGSIKAQLRAGLGYLGAIDDQGFVQPSFKALVAAYGTDEWRDEFRDQFQSWYGDVIDGLDLESATLAQLKDRFRDAGSEGSVVIKATRFFLAGLDEAGMNYSPHFKMRGALTGGTSSPRVKRAKSVARTRDDDDEEEVDLSELKPVPEGFKKLSLPLATGMIATLVLPEHMEEDEWNMLSAYVRMFFGYAKPQK